MTNDDKQGRFPADPAAPSGNAGQTAPGAVAAAGLPAAAAPKPPAPPSLREQMGPLRASLRPDLEISRVPFGGEAHYVLRDPLTGRVHKVDVTGYRILCRMRGTCDLASLAAELLEEGLIDDLDDVFETARDLHRSGLITLPIDDGAERYTRSEKARAKKRQKKFVDFLFLQIPMFSPDAFLDATVDRVRFLFSRAVVSIWALAVFIGLAYVIARFDAFTAPLLDLVAMYNLPWLLVALVVLKVIHEFGHAWCCKSLGGAVPEMGVVLFVGTPLAYCDASTSWAFPRRRDRIAVGLAGMYFESFAALLALFVWAVTEPGPANTIAHQVVFLASVTTLLFNLNPLIRFDGYHVLSDLVSIPNLRTRSIDELRRSFDRNILGLRSAERSISGWRYPFLLGFGVAASIYRVTLTLAICATIATTLFFVGVAMAGIYVVRNLGGFLIRSFKHLCTAEVTAEVRLRSLACAAVLFLGVPFGVAFLPFHWPHAIRGVTRHAQESVVRAEIGGRLRDSDLRTGQRIRRGQPVARLDDLETVLARDEARAELELARLESEGAARTGVGDGQIGAIRVNWYEERLATLERDVSRLTPSAPMDGTVLSRVDDGMRGAQLERGAVLAILGDGPLQIEVALDERSLADCRPAVGQEIPCVLTADPTQRFTARVTEVRPAGSRTVEHAALTSLGGGDIVVDPTTEKAASALFLVRLEILGELPEAFGDRVAHGQTATVRFLGEQATLLRHLTRRVRRFMHEVRQS